MNHRISQAQFAAMLFCLLVLTQIPAVFADNAFSISGVYEVEVDDAVSSVNFNKYGKVWILQIRSTSDYKKKNGTGFAANLFFSQDFTPGTGAFPVQFSYRSKKDTMGGSVTLSGDNRGMFSHDTLGSVTFDAFDERITGTFKFDSFQDDASTGAPRITAQGAFDLPRGEALP